MNFKILYVTKSNSVKIWDPNNLNFVSRPKIYPKFLENICISSKNLIAFMSKNDNNIYIYDLVTGHFKYSTYDNQVKNIQFSPSSKYLVSYCDDHRLLNTCVKIYNYKNNKQIFSTNDNVLPKIFFSPNEKEIILGNRTSSGKINLKMHHLEDEKYFNVCEIDNIMNSKFFNLKWSPYDNYIVANNGNKLYLWNNKFDKLKEIIFDEENSCGTINILSFSSNDKEIIIGFFSGLLKIFNIETENIIVLHDIIDHTNLISINCIEFSQCGKYMIVGKSNGSIDIWDYENKIIKKSFNDLDSSFENKMDLYGDYMMSTGNSRDIVQLSVL
ncbi:WD40 domain-containing protein [Acanthamoeba polyphaga moumouvirus]|uniref:WD40 domain-containing protein n=1 Tax=Acanthamoeba polyphaga moumouvirus TaxID=1269028 RepID=L7RFM5_9VIRU|nr:WD40 domain-containing protein [Acanthamoeba polyphaga moumouvirus]AGC01605.1 WD40 domain-containing protein [Acanthamoeba polyphaga moumouvirus]AQN67929.1 WD40 domain protein [Saudi moumouvirus]